MAMMGGCCLLLVGKLVTGSADRTLDATAAPSRSSMSSIDRPAVPLLAFSDSPPCCCWCCCAAVALLFFACAQLDGSLPDSYGQLASLERLSLNDNAFRCVWCQQSYWHCHSFCFANSVCSEALPSDEDALLDARVD